MPLNWGPSTHMQKWYKWSRRNAGTTLWKCSAIKERRLKQKDSFSFKYVLKAIVMWGLSALACFCFSQFCLLILMRKHSTKRRSSIFQKFLRLSAINSVWYMLRMLTMFLRIVCLQNRLQTISAHFYHMWVSRISLIMWFARVRAWKYINKYSLNSWYS